MFRLELVLKVTPVKLKLTYNESVQIQCQVIWKQMFASFHQWFTYQGIFRFIIWFNVHGHPFCLTSIRFQGGASPLLRTKPSCNSDNNFLYLNILFTARGRRSTSKCQSVYLKCALCFVLVASLPINKQ